MSNADRRSVHTDALATLGTIHDCAQGRDAIHLAVIQAKAAHQLLPGQDVRIKDGEAFGVKTKAEGLGIVDPFLAGPVVRGQLFWLVIYPRVITSLRHVWSHPAIADEAGAVTPVAPMADKAASESWLRQYARRVNSYMRPDEAYQRLMSDIRGGQSITYHGTDMHSLHDLEDADELRHHAQIVLGRPVNWGDFEYFSCTC